MTEFFFVYGTLKKNYSNNRLLGDSLYLGKGITDVGYEVYNVGFPMAYYRPHGLPLLGEVYRVESERVIADIDQLESNGSFYTRVKRSVTIPDFFDQKVEAWVYEIPKANWGRTTLCPVNPEYNAYEWKR
jgi:gamma-glutamylcyclotransferase (GGCT)/AIG2-like uncharacterized protein YtfP